MKNKFNLQKALGHMASVFIFALGMFTLLGFNIQPAHAQGNAGSFMFFTVPARCQTTECGWRDFVALGNEIIDLMVYVAIIGATLTFAWAGMKMMLNAGSSGEIEKAKKMMTTAIIGIVFTLSAWLIVDFILDNLGVEPEFRTLVQ